MIPANRGTPALIVFFILLVCSWSFAEDVIVDIGNGSGTAGSQNNSITLALDNASEIVAGVHVYICDEDNYLTIKNCEATGRASSFSCNFNECRTDAKIYECRRAPGCADIHLFSIGDTIAPGNGPIARITYDVSEYAPSGCISLNPKFATAARPKIQGVLNQRELTVMPEGGQFCISGDDSDDTSTTPRDDNPPTPATSEAASPTESNGSAALAGGSATPSASAQSGLRAPMGGSSGTIQETSTGADEDTFGSPAPSARQLTTGGRSGVSSGASDTRSAGSTRMQSAGEESRLIISPSLSVINSKGVLALDAHTIADGQEVRGKYQWEIQPPSAIGSTIDADGIFTAGINTSVSPVKETIRVTDTVNKSISATAAITIEGVKEPPEGCTLLITPSSAEIAPGNVINFTATKLGKTCGADSYQWKVSSKIGSSITSEGVYTAGKNSGSAAALDIILVKDREEDLSIDALVTVAPGDQFSRKGSSTPANADDARSQKTGIPLLPGTLIAAAAFVAIVGVLLVRKKK